MVPRTRWRRRGKIRRITIVAVARKLLIALWRYVTLGLVPEGAELKVQVWQDTTLRYRFESADRCFRSAGSKVGWRSWIDVAAICRLKEMDPTLP
jgi:hypothetical protein